MVNSSDGVVTRKASGPYETVAYDCTHCRRRTIGVIKPTTKSGVTKNYAHCGHDDCGATTPWPRAPQAWSRSGGLTARQRQGKKHTDS